MTISAENCKWGPRHLPVVTVGFNWRHWFRRRFHVRCWGCNYYQGPFKKWKEANDAREALEYGTEEAQPH